MSGVEPEVVDYDSRGPKYGQMAAVCTGGFFAQFVFGDCTCKLLRDPYNPKYIWQFKNVPDSNYKSGPWTNVSWGGESVKGWS